MGLRCPEIRLKILGAAEPLEFREARLADEFCEQCMVRATDCPASCGRHEDHTCSATNERWQCLECEADVIHDTQLIFGRNENVRAQFHDQFPRTETFAQRTEQPSSAFHQNRVKAVCDFPNVRQHITQLDPLPSVARGQQRRNGQIKVPWVDFIERQRISHRAA
jgi:hypothetical protein